MSYYIPGMSVWGEEDSSDTKLVKVSFFGNT